MTTIKDVAKLAGVSVATVSHVVNNTRFVSEETKEKVLSAMQELSYQPNAIARSLRRKESKILGLVLPDNTNPILLKSRGVSNTLAGMKAIV
jgi:LacI family transcriptional regulator